MEKDTAMTTTPTGIPIRDCNECGYRHPITRKHCTICGRATLVSPPGGTAMNTDDTANPYRIEHA